MTDTTPREFDLADILSITTGRLLSHRHMDGVYEILNYLTGDNLYTHQLPRAALACRGPLLEQHPRLADVCPPEHIAVDEIKTWLAGAENTYGRALPVTPIAGWERREPLAELAQMVGDKPVIVVAQDDDLTPDPALVRMLAARVKAHLGRRTRKVSFADIHAASDADGGWPELNGLNDGQRELLFDDVQTEIG